MRSLVTVLCVAVMGLSSPVAAETVRATIFARTVKDGGGKSPCLGRRVLPTDFGFAHRTLPCGTMVVIRNRRTGKAVIAPVLDRGPFGALTDGVWHIKRRAADPGVWRGGADLTPPVAAALQHKSFDWISLEPLR